MNLICVCIFSAEMNLAFLSHPNVHYCLFKPHRVVMYTVDVAHCVLVTTVIPAKTAEPVQILFGVWLRWAQVTVD